MGGQREMCESMFSWKPSFLALILIRFSLFLYYVSPISSLLCFLLPSCKSVCLLFKCSFQNIWRNLQTSVHESNLPPANMHGIQLCTQHALINNESFVPSKLLSSLMIIYWEQQSVEQYLSIDTVFSSSQLPREEGQRAWCLHQDGRVKSQNTLVGRSHKNTILPIKCCIWNFSAIC